LIIFLLTIVPACIIIILVFSTPIFSSCTDITKHSAIYRNMTCETDWPQVDPMPSMETSTDLFDGDILGDELIDIYNAAVVGDDDEDDDMNEIPTLLGPNPEAEKKESDPLNHPGAPLSDSEIYDGLGAFRPSTSFNDLASLLPPETPAGAGDAPVVAPVTSMDTVLAEASAADVKKRAPDGAPVDAPAAKRRVSTGRKNPGVGSPLKPNRTKAGAVPVKQSNDTPNPLTTGIPPAEPFGLRVQPVQPIAKQPVAAPAPAIVTPRLSTKLNETVAPAAVPTHTPLAPPPTEADFKSVAQAAVSNLIMNAGSTKSEASGNTTEVLPPIKIDTSTEHIKALTGTNWVAVCSGGEVGQAENSAADKMNNRARRQNLTPDERARQNRDRNREHARNTRLRKKAYVEELKRTLTALVTQRDSTELEKRHSSQRELEQREVRFRVIEEFLKLRGRNEVNFARWAAILEENFSLTLPMTDFREMTRTGNDYAQVLSGVSEAMADSNLVAAFLQSLGKSQDKTGISFVYNCDRKNFFMDSCMAVLDWKASTHGAVQQVRFQNLIYDDVQLSYNN
jgi:hypothetical protein